MDTQKALQILVNAAHIAQQKGAFNLNDAKVLAEAVEFFTPKPIEENPVKEIKEKKK